MTGIYKITNKINGRSYVGQSVDIERRWYEHTRLSKRLVDDNAMYLEMHNYGIGNFTFEVLEECPAEKLNEREMYWIKATGSSYNRNEGGSGNRGNVVSEKTRSVLSAYGKMQWSMKSEEEKARILSSNLIGPRKGHEVSMATREKLRAKNLGKKYSEETCEKHRRRAIECNLGGDTRSTRVIGISDDKSIAHEFRSIKQAALHFGVDGSCIVGVLKGRRKHCKGLRWYYGSVETNHDECNGVSVILSHAEVQGIRKDEEIVHGAEMDKSVLPNDKGIVQLALRTGQYSRIETNEVYEGEIEKYNRFTGEITFGTASSNVVVGYLAYFRLTNGMEKYLYMTREQAEAHAKRYSQSYRNDKYGTSLWATMFDDMAKKTVLKLLLSKYGPMSVEMQSAAVFDQSVVRKDAESFDMDYEDAEYVDNEPRSAAEALANLGNDGKEGAL